jgi:hypothetical protein
MRLGTMFVEPCEWVGRPPYRREIRPPNRALSYELMISTE